MLTTMGTREYASNGGPGRPAAPHTHTPRTGEGRGGEEGGLEFRRVPFGPAGPGVMRRAVDVDYDGNARVRVERRARLPRVLAYRHAKVRGRDAYRARRLAWCEVPLLVEHAVVGELHLVVASGDRAPLEEARRVVHPTRARVDEARQHRAAGRGSSRELLHSLQVVLDEPRPENKILRRGAGGRRTRAATA